MCWGVPAKVQKIKGVTAIVDFGKGSLKEVIVAAENIKENDLVVVHAGVIIGKISDDYLNSYLNLAEQLLSNEDQGAGREE